MTHTTVLFTGDIRPEHQQLGPREIGLPHIVEDAQDTCKRAATVVLRHMGREVVLKQRSRGADVLL